jgi:predicted enzyme related to lactoylglutathione lyase
VKNPSRAAAKFGGVPAPYLRQAALRCENRKKVVDYEPSPVGARLVFVALRVRDLEASARFYRDAFGIPLRAAGGSDEETHYEYSWRDGAYLHFALFPAAPGEESRRAEVAFFVDDVDVAHARAVAAGADVTAAPHSEPWGRTAAYRDPDGNAVGLTQRPADSGI